MNSETTPNVETDETGESLTDCEDKSMVDGEAAGLLLGYAETSRDATALSVQGTVIQAVAEGGSNCSEEGVPADRMAAAWVHHLQMGNSLPDRHTLILLLKAMLQSRMLQSTPIVNRGIKLIQIDTEKKFPHMIDTGNGRVSEEEGIWTQCKTKMTHIAVRLCDSNGKSVMGVDLQEGGLQLRLTLHRSAEGGHALTDEDNPRMNEGLFRGRASGAFQDTATLLESRHTFKFQVMLLSSDMGGSNFFIKVSPVHPNMAFNPNLTVRSHSFHSRARMPDHTFQSDTKRQRVSTPESTYNCEVCVGHIDQEEEKY